MRTVHIAAYHPAKDVRVFIKECRTLAAAGYDVHLMVAELPDEPVIDGVTFHKIPRPAGTHMGFRWMIGLWRPLWRIYKAALALDGDVYHLHESELIPVGLLLKSRGKTVIFDSHEDFPRQIYHVDNGRLHRKLYAHVMSLYLHGMMLLSARAFDAFIIPVESMRSYFPLAKTATVHNYAMLAEYPPSPLEHHPYMSRQNRLFYVGGISVKRGIIEMVQAMGLLEDNRAICFYLVGPWNDPQLRQRIEALPGWARIEAPGRLTHDEMIPQMLDSKIGIVLLHPVSQYGIAYPTKLLEYMAAGLPVIASDSPNIREMIAGYEDIIMWVDPYDPRQIAEAITYLLDHPDDAEQRGRRGREVVETRFNWENEAAKLLDLYVTIVGKL